MTDEEVSRQATYLDRVEHGGGYWSDNERSVTQRELDILLIRSNGFRDLKRLIQGGAPKDVLRASVELTETLVSRAGERTEQVFTAADAEEKQ